MKYKTARVLLTLVIISVLIFISYGVWVSFVEALTIYSNQGLKVLFWLVLKSMILPFVLMSIVIYGMMWVFETVEEGKTNEL